MVERRSIVRWDVVDCCEAAVLNETACYLHPGLRRLMPRGSQSPIYEGETT